MDAMKNTINKRKIEPSYLNVLFCLLVVFIHVTSDPIVSLDKLSWQYAAVFFPWRLSAFVVQGFLFLSGLKLFLNHPDGFDYGKLCLSRLKRIVLPYIIWVFVYYAFFISIGYFGFEFKALIRYLCLGNIVSPFYYIIILVQFYLLLTLWRRMVKGVNPVVALVFCTVITLLLCQNLTQIISALSGGYTFKYNDRVFTSYLVYWVGGCFAGANYSSFKELLRKNRAFLCVAFALFALSDGVLSLLSFSGKVYLPCIETLHFGYCISAILFFFSMALAIAEKRPLRCRLVAEIDKVSYAVFLSHCLVLNIVNLAMRKCGITDIATAYFLRIVSVYSITIALCILWKTAVSRIKGKRRG